MSAPVSVSLRLDKRSSLLACGGAVPARHRFMALAAGFRNLN